MANLFLSSVLYTASLASFWHSQNGVGGHGAGVFALSAASQGYSRRFLDVGGFCAGCGRCHSELVTHRQVGVTMSHMALADHRWRAGRCHGGAVCLLAAYPVRYSGFSCTATVARYFGGRFRNQLHCKLCAGAAGDAMALAFLTIGAGAASRRFLLQSLPCSLPYPQSTGPCASGASCNAGLLLSCSLCGWSAGGPIGRLSLLFGGGAPHAALSAAIGNKCAKPYLDFFGNLKSACNAL